MQRCVHVTAVDAHISGVVRETGSDDGRVWIYAADTGRPVASMAADQDVVNAVQVTQFSTSVLTTAIP